MVLKPTSEGELAEAIAAAKAPLCVVGGGTRGFITKGDRLDLAGLSGVSLYEPGALTIVAAAGTSLAEVEAVLAEGGQMLAFEPMNHGVLLGTDGVSTMGGVAAANVSGPRRIQAGACRDAMLGIRFVDGTGAVVKNGGRVMKNVTGYDLVKLMAGSFGTLGVLSEVALKVLPRPEAMATVQVDVKDAASAVAAMAAALGSPYDVSGAAYLPGKGALLRLEGFEASVRYRAGALGSTLGRFGEASTSQDGATWAEVRDAAPLKDHAAVWRLSAKPSAAPGILEALKPIGVEDFLLDWGGGLVWFGLSAATREQHAQVQQVARTAGGHATLVKVPPGLENAPRFQPPSPGVGRLEAGLRAKFDPRGILNPGLVGNLA